MFILLIFILVCLATYFNDIDGDTLKKQELLETLLKAHDANCTIPVRYGKVLFCGVAAAGKSNFLNLLMENDFQPKHISTVMLKPQQVTIATKVQVSSNDDIEVEFEKMSIDDEISQLWAYFEKMSIDDEISQLSTYLPETTLTPTSSPQASAAPTHDNFQPPAQNTEDTTAEEPSITNTSKVKELPKRSDEVDPLLIQFKSNDNKNKAFPRGAFCCLVVQLMISERWKIKGQAFVNKITLIEKDTALSTTLIDRIFCLEVHVTHLHGSQGNIHKEVREIISRALLVVARTLKIHNKLCHGFFCKLCPGHEKKHRHISHVEEENNNYCYCDQQEPTDLTADSRKVWFTSYFKVCKFCI